MIEFTKEQQSVIDARNRDILVSAAAGSGKTAVLVERIIKRLLDEKHPVDIDHMLVVTFTRAAAKEMKEKIRVALDERLKEHPGDAHLKKQATYVFHSQITTIDSFCNYLVKNYFYTIGVEPDFRIISSNEYALMETEIIDALFKECYETKEEGFLRLVDTYGTDKSDGAVSEMVLAVANEAMTNPWPFEWLDGLCDLYQVSSVKELQESDMITSLLAETKQALEDLVAELKQRKEIEESCEVPPSYVKTMGDDIAHLEMILEADSYDGFAEKLAIKFPTLCKKTATDDEEKRGAFQKYRDDYKKRVGELQKKYAFSLEDVVGVIQTQKAYVKTLTDLARRFINMRHDYLEKKNAWDFNDIEHFALEILKDKDTKEPTAVAEELLRFYEEIMVDEYQDSNYLQEEILRTITREKLGDNNYFMVGDIKQSIYRFRQARPEIFKKKYQLFSLEEAKQQKFELNNNFRSRSQVVDAVNDVFLKLMDASVGGVAYDEKVSLKHGADYFPKEGDDAYRTEVLIGIKDKDLLQEFELEDKSELEARIILSRIQKLMQGFEVYDKDLKGLRPIRYSDIVILLRSTTNRDTYLQILNENGVPAFSEKASGFFDTTEVQTVVSFLSILDNPRQDIPLVSVLKSKMFSFTEEELLSIRMEYPKELFHKALFLYAAAHPKDEKLQGFLNTLNELREKTDDTPIHELLQMIYEKTDYLTYVYALPGGKNRKANLLKLIDLAIQFEQTSFKGLFRFCNYIDRLKKKSASEGEAELLSEEDDVVRIMTIHHSKGLEFPVVFLSEISKQFNVMDTRGKMVLHSSKGLALDDISLEKRIKRESLLKNYISNAIYRDTIGEEMRLLYVAMTRAKEKLILTGTYEADKIPETLKGNFTDAMRLKNAGYGGWMIPVFFANPKSYDIKTITPQDLASMEVVDAISKESLRKDLLVLSKEIKPNACEALEQNLKKAYPFETTFSFKGKYSVSELKHKAMESVEEKDASPLPFSEGVVSPGAAKGTAMHRFMECFDFSKMDEDRILDKELSRVKEEKLMKEDEIALLDKKQLVAFFTSDTAKQMKEASVNGKLYREQPFVFGDSAKSLLSEVYPDYSYPKDGGPMILLQGIIDVFYETEDGFVLLDYKTDRVANGEELKNRYAKQMDLYADAIESAYDKKVIRRVLYSFSLGEEVVL